MSTRHRTAVRDNCKRNAPPAWMRTTVERLLDSLAPEHVSGLEAVVLSDFESVRKGKTKRVGKRKYSRRECLGFYHARSAAGGAWVELIVDNVVPAQLPRCLLWFQIVRDLYVANTLYHEIGHHLDETVGAARRSGEAAAEDWRRRLSRIHFRKRYWYLIPAIQPLKRVAKLLQYRRRRRPAA